MSDVVERLRDWPAGGQDMLSSTVVGGMMEEAADEIERLREALARQTENLAFVLNRVDFPEQWYAAFTTQLAEDRAALKGNQ